MLNRITIAETLSRLRQEYADRAPSYGVLYKAILESRVPAEKQGKAWMVDARDWSRVTTGLRLSRPAPRRIYA